MAEASHKSYAKREFVVYIRLTLVASVKRGNSGT